MRVQLSALCLALVCAPAAQAAPAKADPRDGKAVFEKWCAACHAPNPRLAGTLALQTKYEGKIPAALEARTDLTPEIVAAFVRNGVAWMAPFRKTEISDAELADLGDYLTKTPGTKGKAR
ncbi:MAG: cytochrome c [Sphingobium sp.]|nr:cytochrome c [Sphingobium sp.]